MTSPIPDSIPAKPAGVKSDWREAASKIPVITLVPKNATLTIIDSEANFHQCLGTLANKQILSAPVFDRQQRKFIGLIDILDLLAYAVTVFTESALRANDVKLTDYTVKFLKDCSSRNPWCPIYQNMPITSLIDVFAKSKIHRVPLVNDDGKVVGLVSQSRMVQFMAEHIDLLPKATLEASISSAMTSPVKSVHNQTRTADAFSKLLDDAVSGIAVVDDAGKITGYLSGNHLKSAVLGNVFHDFYLPAQTFIESCAQKYTKRPSGPVCLPPTATVGEAIRLLSSRHLHRLWVIDSESKPIGVVSLCDVINYIDSQP